ncbi:MAG: DUF512 domain-containing protein [Clostridiales bacterium]|nr:DUF512 domain-containing protein [Clostridiales bacterium]MCF8023231.1 DUF512 domain-containing protein [Clostridiales bacterium]
MGGSQLKVQSVSPDGIAAEMGIEPGDFILRIDDREVFDIIDYRFYIAEDKLNVLLEKQDGDLWLLDIEKDWDENLGIVFENDGLGKIKRCRNKCIFCFVDQLPRGMRKSLGIKDDDYRLSFSHGNFITLTNANHEDLQRIASMRITPLYISVHTTNPRLRAEMMRNPGAGKILEQLEFLVREGIEIHAQAVLCPGINDGEELEKTVRDLAGLWPGVRSLALVPVGLTGYREGLYDLKSFTIPGAREILYKVEKWQEEFVDSFDYPFVFAADEFYLLAGKSFPIADCYGGFPQVENGVGLSRLFEDRWNEIKRNLPLSISVPAEVKVVTGQLALPVLQTAVEDLNKIQDLHVQLVPVENNFWGREVTVSGLLTGRDIMEQVDSSGVDIVIVPASALKADAPVFLDDITLEDLSCKLGIPVKAAETAGELVEAITGQVVEEETAEEYFF